jgi:hypothetical protein
MGAQAGDLLPAAAAVYRFAVATAPEPLKRRGFAAAPAHGHETAQPGPASADAAGAAWRVAQVQPPTRAAHKPLCAQTYLRTNLSAHRGAAKPRGDGAGGSGRPPLAPGTLCRGR